ncbi:hypothetical protein D3C75_569340 [compost metagenome]
MGGLNGVPVQGFLRLRGELRNRRHLLLHLGENFSLLVGQRGLDVGVDEHADRRGHVGPLGLEALQRGLLLGTQEVLVAGGLRRFGRGRCWLLLLGSELLRLGNRHRQILRVDLRLRCGGRLGSGFRLIGFDRLDRRFALDGHVRRRRVFHRRLHVRGFYGFAHRLGESGFKILVNIHACYLPCDCVFVNYLRPVS